MLICVMSTTETKMSKRSSVKFQQILAWLMTEVMFGKTHYGIVRGLGRRDREALAAFRTAPRFFDMTLGAHADSAQMTVARIYDRTSAASIHKLFSSALREAGTFRHGTVTDVQKAVQESKAIIKAIEPTLAAIRTRRNQTMAHLDARPFADPAGYVSAGRVSYRQLDELFERTSEILNRFSLLHRGATVPLLLEDAKDYERAIDLLAAAASKFSQAAGST
jgi:AbiU2